MKELLSILRRSSPVPSYLATLFAPPGWPGYHLRVQHRTIPFYVGLLVLTLGLSGCPKRQTRIVGGTKPVPAMALPSDGDVQARSRFEMSRNQFEQNAEIDSSEAFEAIVRDFPTDPIVPHALLYGAMADIRKGAAQEAHQKLAELKALHPTDPTLVSRASLMNGLVLTTLGRGSEALAELQAGERVLKQDDQEEMLSWHAAMAEAASASGKLRLAILHYDMWWSDAGAAEKAYAVDKISQLTVKLPEAELKPVFLGLPNRVGPAAASIGSLLIPLLANSADPQVDQLLVMIESAQRAMGIMPVMVGNSGPGNPEIVGALLPMTGRLNRVGELSLRALVMASGQSPSQKGSASAFEVVALDTHSSAALVGDGMQSLVRGEAVAVIGPFDGSALKKASPLASRLGVPLISLAPRGAAGVNVFSIRHSAEARARALAGHAFSKGIRDFAIFSPSTSYGQVVGRAFRLEVERLGGTVVVDANYPKGTTSFKSHVAKLRKPWSAVFIPDLAKNLQLIAPALAASNLNARPIGTKSKRGRSILLLSTAEGVDLKFLRAAGRYSFGAVLAPGFYPDRTDDRIADFVAQYEAEFGSEPTSHEAYAYDAAAVIRYAVNSGARARGQVSQALAEQTVPGLTGTITFDGKGRRSDPGLLFEVQQPIAGQFELKAMR